MKTNGAILRVAFELVNAERQDDYGPPADSMARIASLWTAYLNRPVSAKDVCLMLAMLKIAREAHAHKPDNLLDAAGYIGLAGDLAQTEPQKGKAI